MSNVRIGIINSVLFTWGSGDSDSQVSPVVLLGVNNNLDEYNNTRRHGYATLAGGGRAGIAPGCLSGVALADGLDCTVCQP